MAGELSPDRLYYWDGSSWRSAFSPDGSWRWDGRSWQPASSFAVAPAAAPARRSSRLPWAIAAVVIATLVVGSGGVYLMASYLLGQSQRLFQAQVLGATCTSPGVRAGAPLAEGDTLCGTTLGPTAFSGDCTGSNGMPAGTQAWVKSKGDTQWTSTELSADSTGCRLVAAPGQELVFDTADKQPAAVVAVVDFIPNGATGDFGLQVACQYQVSCLEIMFYRDATFSLDELKPGGGWDNVTQGDVFFLAAPGKASRLILRLAGRVASVFLNGVELTHGTVSRDQASGPVDFYLDDRSGTATEMVWLQRLQVFKIAA